MKPHDDSEQGSPDEADSKARDALTLVETAELLAKLQQELSKDMIARTRRGIKDGKPDELAIRKLLVEFVRRAPGIRKHMGGEFSGYTPDVVQFVASCVDAFVSGDEPDLMKAFGLTKSGRGPKLKSATRLQQEAGAADVLELMAKGEKLEVACRIVAEARGVSPATVRDWYSTHHASVKKTHPNEWSPAERMLIYRGLLHRSQPSDDQTDD